MPPRSDPRKLSEVARHVIHPKGITTTAWPRVSAKCAEMGVTFDGWQHGVGTLALGKLKNGKYAATVGGVVLSIPRQVGKTFLVGMIIIALCLLHPGLTVLWTAHRERTATKTFKTFQGMVRKKKIWPHILTFRETNGQQEIAFRNRSVIMFGAREGGFGRGFDEVDVEVFDEAQILGGKALEDMIAATNQSRQEAGALLFFMGTPPRPSDPGEEFANRRKKALSGKAPKMVYVEFSADESAEPDDRAQWAKANPSFPLRTPVDAMERMRENLTDEQSFKREALGIWDPADTPRVIDKESWDKRADPLSIASDRKALAIDVSPDQSTASLALSGQRDDGSWHIELWDARAGTAWLVPTVADILERNPDVRAVVADAASPAGSMAADFLAAGITLTLTNGSDMGAACAALLRGIYGMAIWHTGQQQADDSLNVARKRTIGEAGLWGWSRANSTANITPTVAQTLALWGAMAPDAKVKRPRKKVYRRPVFA